MVTDLQTYGQSELFPPWKIKKVGCNSNNLINSYCTKLVTLIYSLIFPANQWFKFILDRELSNCRGDEENNGKLMVFILAGNSEIDKLEQSVIRKLICLWLFFNMILVANKRLFLHPVFLYTIATCSELPSHVLYHEKTLINIDHLLNYSVKISPA